MATPVGGTHGLSIGQFIISFDDQSKPIQNLPKKVLLSHYLDLQVFLSFFHSCLTIHERQLLGSLTPNTRNNRKWKSS